MSDSATLESPSGNAAAGLTWNAGAWFGSQLGATCWMLLAGLSALPSDRVAAQGVLVLGGVANAVGFALWRSKRLSCHASMQVLVATAGVCGAGCVFLLDRAGLWESIQVGSSVSAAGTYAILGAVYLGLMLMFYLRFGRAAQSPAR